MKKSLQFFFWNPYRKDKLYATYKAIQMKNRKANTCFYSGHRWETPVGDVLRCFFQITNASTYKQADISQTITPYL